MGEKYRLKGEDGCVHRETPAPSSRLVLFNAWFTFVLEHLISSSYFLGFINNCIYTFDVGN